MSIYGNVVFNESYNGKPVITDTIESIMEDDSIVLKDENEDFVTEGLEAVAVMTENYSNFMQRVGVSELSAIYATGDEMIYTEGVVSDFLGGIKKFIMKIWEKIKSLFKRFIMVIDSYTKNDKAFITKYRQQIYRHKSLSDFTFKGYKYVIKDEAIKAAIEVLTYYADIGFTSKDDLSYAGGYADEFRKGNTSSGEWDQDTAGKYQERHDDRMEKIRGRVVESLKSGTKQTSDKGTYTPEEYRKEIDEILRNNESEKEELTDKDIDVDDMVTELQNSKQTKKTINDIFKENKKHIDANIKAAERLHKEHTRDMPVTDEKLQGKVTVNDVDNDLVNTNKTLFNSATTVAAVKAAQGYTGNDADEKTKEYIAKTINSHKLGKAKSDSKVKAADLSEMIKVTHATKGMLITLDSCVLKALKERSRQYKACLVKIVYHNPKNESSFSESYDYGSYNNYNFISNIQFK